MEVIDLYAPRSWKELDQKQLRYVLRLMVKMSSPVNVVRLLGRKTTPHQLSNMMKCYMLVRFTGLKVEKRVGEEFRCSFRTGMFSRRQVLLPAWQVHELMQQFNYVDELDTFENRLESIRGLQPVDVRLHGVKFGEYLNMEKYFFIYQQTKRVDMLEKLALLLYRDEDGGVADEVTLDEVEQLNVYLWYASCKANFSRKFPHFFKKVEPGYEGDVDLMESFNVQIRALADGDVTKENTVYDIDCWRALTELNAKARDAKEMKQRMERERAKYGK